MSRHRSHNLATDLGLLTLRLTMGGLMAGHGAQKLFGIFGGHGIQGTAGFLETLGLKPGQAWAFLAGTGEFGSGVLMALGFLNPIGPIGVFGPMIMAWTKAHAGKPIWTASGGAELPLAYLTTGTTLALTGPGRFSLDAALDIDIPRPLVALTVVGVAAGIVAGIVAQSEAAPAASVSQNGSKDQAQASANPTPPILIKMTNLTMGERETFNGHVQNVAAGS